jgi:hypothetical protein
LANGLHWTQSRCAEASPLLFKRKTVIPSKDDNPRSTFKEIRCRKDEGLRVYGVPVWNIARFADARRFKSPIN